MVNSIVEAVKRTERLIGKLNTLEEMLLGDLVENGQRVLISNFIQEMKIISEVEIGFLRNMDRVENYPTFCRTYLEVSREKKND